jgi:hypothetical protein
MAAHGTKNTTEPPVLEEPPSLRRLNNTFEGDLSSFDNVTSTDDEPPSLRRPSGKVATGIKTLQYPSSTATDDEPPSLSPVFEGQGLASDPLRLSESDGDTSRALSPSPVDDDDASNSTSTMLKSLDEMVKSLEASTPTRLLEGVKSNDVKEVKSPLEETSTANKRAAADPDAHSYDNPIDPDALSNGNPIDPDALSNGSPILVESIDNDFGIPLGDTMISLLNEDTDTSWASRTDEAIWRCRTMRRSFDSKYLEGKPQPGSPSLGRTSVPVDVDDARVIGGVRSVPRIQGAALEHLKYDDFDDALMLYEDIIFSYYRYFDEVLKKGEDGLSMQDVTGNVSDFKPYIGAALHNIGMVHLLKGDHEAAFTHFERAQLNRATCLGIGHVDHVVSSKVSRSCVLLPCTGLLAYSQTMSPVDLSC